MEIINKGYRPTSFVVKYKVHYSYLGVNYSVNP